MRSWRLPLLICRTKLRKSGGGERRNEAGSTLADRAQGPEEDRSMAAAGIAVSVSMGALKPVLEKLATLLGDKYKKIKGLRKEVSFLMEELSDIKVLLENMDNAEDELTPQAKKWRKDIIDMSYDIEDCIDNFLDRVGDADDKVGVLKKASHYLRTIKDRYRIANQISEIKTRVIEASQRRDRYNLNVLLCASSSTTKVVVDPRLTALYKDSTTLVGIDNQKEELVRWVEGEEKQLKVMSIVGFGGLGKTTLANEVYHKVRGHFNRNAAFVPVSQKPDVPRLLSKVCSKLGLSPSSHACDVQELIDTLRQHLNDKRYSFVLILITLPYLTYKVSYVLTLIFDHILIQYNIYIDVLLSLHCRIIFYPNS
jgi:hypothetical protein